MKESTECLIFQKLRFMKAILRLLLTTSILLLSNIGSYASDVISSVTASGNTFTITRSDSKGPCRVYYSTQDGSAVGGIHYLDASGTLEFVDGELSKTVNVILLSPTDMNKFSTVNSRDFWFYAWNDQSSKSVQAFISVSSSNIIEKSSVYDSEIANTNITGGGSPYMYCYDKKDTFVSTYRQYAVPVADFTRLFSAIRKNYLAALNQDYKYIFRMTFGAKVNEESSVLTSGRYGYSSIAVYEGSVGPKDYAIDAPGGEIIPWQDGDIPKILYDVTFQTNVTSSGSSGTYSIPVEGTNSSFADGSYKDIWSSTSAVARHRRVLGSCTSDGKYLIIPNSTEHIGFSLGAAGTTRYDDLTWSKYSWCFLNSKMYLAIYDNVGPKVVNAHVNTLQPYHAGQELRVSLEFDEVVTNATSSSLYVMYGGTNTNYILSYKSGDGTNVLTYSRTLSEPTSKVSDLTINSLSSYAISDICGNTITSTSINKDIANFSLLKTYEVILNTNSGTINGCNVTKYYAGAEKILPTEVTRPGYTFGGWYLNSDFSGSRQYSISATATGAKTYYAMWIPNAYTVSLHTNGGNITSGEVTNYSTGTSVTLPTATEIVRTGYTFAGWYQKADFSDTRMYSIAATAYGNKEYYAKWTPKSFYITLDNQDATTTGTTSVYATYDAALSSITVPTKQGYSFGGYYTAANGLGTQYYTATGASTKSLCDLTVATTLYAKWTPNTYVLTLDNQSATVSGSSNVIVTYGLPLPSISAPSKIGCSFNGYYSETNGGGTKYYTEFGVDNGNAWTTDSDGTLYAKWTPNTYNITLETNGGNIESGNVTQYTYTIGESLPTTLNKKGYEFVGWYANSNFEGELVNEVTATDYGDKTFYAKWTPKEYNVVLDPVGGKINIGDVNHYTYGTYTMLPTDVTKAGCTFKGWFPMSQVSLYLNSFDPANRISIVKTVKTLTGLSLSDALSLVNSAPVMLKEGVEYYKALTYQEELESSGASVTIIGGQVSDGLSVTDVVLESYPTEYKLNILKVVREYTGLGLKEAKDLVDEAAISPTIIMVQTEQNIANNLKSDLEALGATISFANQSGNQSKTTIYPTDEGDIYLTAQWENNTYAVRLEVNGGTTTQNLSEYVYGIGATLPTISEISREGYTFGGWYQNSNFDGNPITEISLQEYGDKTFYAKWIINSYAIILDPNGGTINSGNVTNYTYNTMTILPTDITRTGYNFAGWKSIANSDFVGTYLKNPVLAANKLMELSDISIQDAIMLLGPMESKLPVTLAENATVDELALYRSVIDAGEGTFELQNHTLSTDGTIYNVVLNDLGSCTTLSMVQLIREKDSDIGVEEAKAMTENLPSIIKSEMTSLENATQWLEAMEAIGADVSIQTIYKSITSISNTEIGAKAYLAMWSKIDYNITYNANDGSFTSDPVTTYNYGDELTLPVPTREGYTFGGWYNNSNLVGMAFTTISSDDYGNKEFWAKWEVNTYDVTLNTNGGEINSGNITTYIYDVLAILPVDVTKAGFNFGGWFNNEACEGTPVTQISKGTIDDQEFWAKWTAKTYTVVLQTNNGVINSGNITSYTYGVGATLPTDVTKTGYEFVGWFDNSSYDGGVVTEIANNEVGNKNFWAKWTAATYDVVLNANGGIINDNDITKYTYGVGAILPTNVTRVGYTFKGWKDADGNAVLEITTADKGDKSYTAQWELTQYAIGYNANGGTINESYESIYTLGSEITLPTDVSRVGSEFIGWYDNVNMEGSVVTNITANEYGDKNFYAAWSSNEYTVTFETNGGTITVGIIENYTYGVTAVLPTKVSKSGYTFMGWYDNPELTGDVVSIIASTEFGPKTYYAKWSTDSYAVTLNTNNGVIAAGNVSGYVFGVGATLPTAEQISKTGNTFKGWYDNSSCEGEIQTTIAADAIGDKEFWAKWSVNSYAISLNVNGGTINSGNVATYVYGNGATLPADVTKTGNTFAGWYATEDLSGDRMVKVDESSIGDKTFYAKWTPKLYNVILVVNEGTINEGNIETYTYGAGAILPTNVTKEGYTFEGWYSNSSYIGGAITSIADNDCGDKQFWAKWSINNYAVSADYDKLMGTISGEGLYEYKSTATLKAVANDGYEFVGWNEGIKEGAISFVVTKDSTVVANFKEKEKVEVAGTLVIPTLKTEREAEAIDLTGLFITTEGSEVNYSATSSQPNVVAATVNDGKLYLTVYEYEGEAEITVTGTLANGEKNFVKATATVILACNIQVSDSIKNVSCFGENDGEIALKISNATEPYTIQWIGETFVEDTISNLVANNYTINIVDAEACTFQKTYTVTQPEEMTMKATIKNPTCSNADGAITITTSGVASATYSWSNEATTQNIANLAKGEYALTITNVETGCQISENYTLMEPTAPIISVANVVATACNEANGAVTISANEDNLIYSWSNNKTTKNLTNVRAGDYTLNVVNQETNCTASLDVTVPSIALKQPEIALVTVSQETDNNLVVWLKENTDLIDFYTVYRQSEELGRYEAIAQVPFSELSVYEDTEVNPKEMPWSYRISATDVCGTETAMSETHKTMQLIRTQDPFNKSQYDLNWTAYEGLDFSSYIVMRERKLNNRIVIDTLKVVSSDITTYSDTESEEGTIGYYVGIKLPSEINPKTQFLKAESGPFSLALSNIAEAENEEETAVEDVEVSTVEVYAVGHTIYVKNAEGQDVAIYDNSGHYVLGNTTQTIETQQYAVRLDGVYFVKVGAESFAVVIR